MTMLIVLGGGVALMLALALLALDQWQRAPQVRLVEPAPEPDESEPDPIVPRRGAHRPPRSMRNRLAAWRAAPALHLGRRRGPLRRSARRPRPALSPRLLMRGG